MDITFPSMELVKNAGNTIVKTKTTRIFLRAGKKEFVVTQEFVTAIGMTTIMMVMMGILMMDMVMLGVFTMESMKVNVVYVARVARAVTLTGVPVFQSVTNANLRMYVSETCGIYVH